MMWLLAALVYCTGLQAQPKMTMAQIQEKAVKGDPEGQTLLGECLLSGNGTKRDYTEAVRWFTKAAKQNYPQAQTDLGYCHEAGLGVEKNFKEAVEWYKKGKRPRRAMPPTSSTWAPATICTRV